MRWASGSSKRRADSQDMARRLQNHDTGKVHTTEEGLAGTRTHLEESETMTVAEALEAATMRRASGRSGLPWRNTKVLP